MKRIVLLQVVAALALVALTASVVVADWHLYDCEYTQQGFLSDSDGNALDTTVSITYAIYDDSTSGAQLWIENHPTVTVDSGQFSVRMGSIIPIPDSAVARGIGWGDTARRWLQVTIDGEDIEPRTEIGAVPRAHFAQGVDGHIVTEPSLMYIPDTAGNPAIELSSDADDGTVVAYNRFERTSGDLVSSITQACSDAAALVNFVFFNTMTDDTSGVSIVVDSNVALLDVTYKTTTATMGYGIAVDKDCAAMSFVAGDNSSVNIVVDDMGPTLSLVGSGRADSVSITNLGITFPDGSSLTTASVEGSSCWECPGTSNYTYLTDIDDSVGIGTDTPSEKLEVVGNLRVTGQANIGIYNGSPGQGAFVAGGGNDATGDSSVVVGGNSNSADHFYSAVVGGYMNAARYDFAIVGGGIYDTVNALYGGVFSGYSNLAGNGAADTAATVAGGFNNTASARYSYIGGGMGNTASGHYSTVSGGGGTNPVDGNVASGMQSTVAGGIGNTATNSYASIGGGIRNIASGSDATIAGGWQNTASMNATTVGGGGNNTASGWGATVSGGDENEASAPHSTVSGGRYNVASGEFAGIVSGDSNTCAGDYSAIGGGQNNFAENAHSTVGGGKYDTALAFFSGVFSGCNNVAGDDGNDTGAVILGGVKNSVTAPYSAIVGGFENIVSESYSIIGGGYLDTVSGMYSGILGGYKNSVAGNFSVIPGGQYNTISSTVDYSMAFGCEVCVDNDFRVIFFEADSSGRVGINRDCDNGVNYPIHVGTDVTNGNGAYLTEGGVWTLGTGKTSRGGIETLDGQDVLGRIDQLPAEAWTYAGTDERHIFPSTESFLAQFDVGDQSGSTGLAAADMAGVALIGVQELYRMVRQQQELAQTLEEKTDEIAQLRAEMAQLTTLVEMILAQQHNSDGSNSGLASNR
ncbi:MAG: hypothetical protein KOO62_06320 [candidate division Zixibacteria bacterium]|nr:hypothetical protein [candidate division Zixibacteria bacterium]